ncbi:MAG TPA: holo-ACP synthase [Burkholderiales bacterium]|nr:holo-ACP synthase [Burkholderiales bacterium]
MIYGIGTDIVEIGRLSVLSERFGERLPKRILSGNEWQAYEKSAMPVHFLAKRFAAKEAFSKALGTGLRHPVTFGAISVVNDSLGKPGFSFDSDLEAFLRERGITNHHLSLSDERHVACAFVILER